MPLDLSIITITFNSESSVSLTIDSVKKQKHKPKEHIFIDGASSDNTLNIIKSQKADYHKVISEPDTGIYNAFNKGARLATSKYIAFLNADDAYAPESSELLVKSLESDCDIIHADVALTDENDNVVFTKKPNPKKLWLLGRYLNHPAMIVKRDLFEKFGYFNESYNISADLDWFLRVWQNRPTYHYIPHTLTYMRKGGVSYQPKINFENFEIRKKHYGLTKALVFMSYYSTVQLMRRVKHSLK